MAGASRQVWVVLLSGNPYAAGVTVKGVDRSAARTNLDLPRSGSHPSPGPSRIRHRT